MGVCAEMTTVYAILASAFFGGAFAAKRPLDLIFLIGAGICLQLMKNQ
jgi:hypothetical protein